METFVFEMHDAVNRDCIVSFSDWCQVLDEVNQLNDSTVVLFKEFQGHRVIYIGIFYSQYISQALMNA